MDASATLTQGHCLLVDASRTPLWEVRSAEIAVAQIGGELTSSAQRARCQALAPGLDTVIQADYLTWNHSQKRMALRGVEVSSAQEEASFRVPEALWTWAQESFTTEGPATFQRGEMQARGESLRADTALRVVHLSQVTAKVKVKGTEVWAASADAAQVTEEAAILKEVQGRLIEGTSPLIFTAPQATWRFTEQTLALEGDLRVQQKGTVVTTSNLIWSRPEARLKGTRPVVLQGNGLRLLGNGLTAQTDLLTAQVTAVRATLHTAPNPAEIRGQRGALTPAGTLVVHQARATLRQTGRTVAITAARAEWDPEAQTLHLSGRVQAQQGDRTVRMAEALWSRRIERFVGTGEVRMQEGSATLTGEDLQTDTAMQTASLAPARLTGGDQARGQTWTIGAQSAVRKADGTLVLKQVTGTVTDAAGPVELAAEQVRWRPPDPVISAQGQVSLQAPAHGLRLQAERIEWDRDAQQVTATGRVKGVMVRNPSEPPTIWWGEFWVYDLATQAIVEAHGD